MQLLTPQQLRERLVEFYMATYKRAFGSANRQLLERKVVADLEYVERAKAVAPPPRVTPAAPPPRQANAVAAAGGMSIHQQPGQRYRPGFLHGNPWLISERWAAATARIARILEGSNGSELLKAVSTAGVPRLGKKFLDAYGYYMTRGRPAPIAGVDHNPYRGLSDKDAARLFMRQVEDICDESTRELGGWFVR